MKSQNTFIEERLVGKSSLAVRPPFFTLPQHIVNHIYSYDPTERTKYNRVINDYNSILKLYKKQFIHLPWNSWFNSTASQSETKSNLFSKRELYIIRVPFMAQVMKRVCVCKIGSCRRECSECKCIVSPHRFRKITPIYDLYCSRNCHEKYYAKLSPLSLLYRPILKSNNPQDESDMSLRFLANISPAVVSPENVDYSYNYTPHVFIEKRCNPDTEYWELSDDEQWTMVSK